jgi:phage gp46-like protein
MQDIEFVKNETSKTYDIAIENGDLKAVDNFDTAINMSLLTNIRAGIDVIIPENRNGWLGNTESIFPGRVIGSLLWILSQARLNQDNINKAVDYSTKALNWMIEDNVVSNITVNGSILPKQGIQLEITITALTGIVETRYFNLWELTGK